MIKIKVIFFLEFIIYFALFLLRGLEKWANEFIWSKKEEFEAIDDYS